jgi:hypothetical protein
MASMIVDARSDARLGDEGYWKKELCSEML